MTSRPDPRVGTDLGPYHIESVIGRGGMGVVYLAEERRLKRRVALKVLPPGLADDADYRARFERESQMAAAIDDPNILPIYEAGEVDGELFLAMRYVEGTDLEARLRDGPMEPRAVVRLLGQVASALDAAHLRGLIHRDVKPGNILIASGQADERGEHAYLTDFGLTKLRTQDTSLTRVGTIMGTLDYMAPEQLEARDVDGAADQYALAVIAHRALTGQLPFERDSEAALITAILRDPPSSAAALRPELAPGTDAVLAEGMAKSPVDRYPSCAAFVSALREAIGVTDVVEVGRAGGTQIDRRLAVALAIAAVVVGVTAFAWAMAANPGSSPTSSPLAGSGGLANPDPSAFPNSDETAVLALLPADVATTCRRGAGEPLVAETGATGRPLAHLDCTLRPGDGVGAAADRLEIWKLGDSTLVTPDLVVARAALDHATPSGDCMKDIPGAGPWSLDDVTLGQAACWVDGTDAVIEWSHAEDGLLFRAARGDRDEGGVIGIWATIADAVWTALGRVDPDPFPSADEQAALALVPSDYRDTCTRGRRDPLDTESGSTVIVPVAGLICDLPAGLGANTLELRLLPRSSEFSPEIIIGFEARARGIEPGDCATTSRAHGRWSIGGSEVGAVVCYPEGDGRANISWTKTDRDLYAWAIREDGDQAGLWDWFSANARFIGQ